MSLTTSLSIATSGLAANSRVAQVISSNVSNATTEGYAKREVVLRPHQIGNDGAGVRVNDVVRTVDETLLREVRLATASSAHAKELSDFERDALALLGEPQDPGSLSARTAELERSLLTAVSRPDSQERLSDVLHAAKSLTEKINSASEGIQTLRQDAEKAIAQEVSYLNQNLAQIADLNAQILKQRSIGQSVNALLDARQAVVDQVSEAVPVRELQRDNGTIALYSVNGAALVDVNSAQFEFSERGFLTPDMTLESGALSGLIINGRQVETNSGSSPIAGGRLAALFTVRDEVVVKHQSNLDTFAYDLVSRFQDPGLDPTLAPGDAGLFTDGGMALDPTNVVGLSQRLSVNAIVDPQTGGALWHLRDGLGAPAAGPSGNPEVLNALLNRLTEPQTITGGTLTPTSYSVSEFAAGLVSDVAQSLTRAETTTAFENTKLLSLQDQLLGTGVDTDAELQKLLIVEQAYAANARVIQTADSLLQILMEI